MANSIQQHSEGEMTEQQRKPDKVYSWQTGMPTKPDVDALLKQWPELQVGDLVAYEDVEALLGSAWHSARFKSVTHSWRARWREKGVILECRPGEAFYCASADQVSAMTYDQIKGIQSKARRHRQKLAAVATENDTQREVINHQGRLMLAIEENAKKQRMNVLPSTASKPAPTALPPAALKKVVND